ncbi:related to makorin ring zinc finger protein [Sporisorium reilianum f. sp. reilianum]|uniref:Related to makorin ring zinc finger protein n=1 Tax=Sporisorium reilianum f. sp. reilianum TaxID=72559 RepID=A0A2N8U8L2_9BASI|nr:related to makorin ring zinc finger protein [Sporisorium reilianum f. sp. reilianum]
MQAEASSSCLAAPSTRAKQDTLCRYFYRSGKCKRGDKCIFSHDSTRDRVQQLSARAAEFTPGPASRSSLSASAQAFQPATQTDSSDDDDEGAWQDVAPEPQPATSKKPAPAVMKGVPASVSENTQPCYICMEIPTVYAQQLNCDHLFCPPCLQKWRRQHGQAKNKNCPTCRTPSQFTFVTPEPFVGGARSLALQRFRERAAQTPCKHFTKSLALSSKRMTKPFCIFGDDCLYQHHIDSQPHKFGTGRYRIQRGKRGTRRIVGLRGQAERVISTDFFARIQDMDERVRMFLSTRVILNARSQASAA